MSHLQSKKWSAALMGTACVLFVFVVTVVATLFADPAKAGHLVGLANIATVALSALITTLVAGQSCVDWRHGSSTQYEAIDRRSTDEQVDRTFAPKHFDDENLQ